MKKGWQWAACSLIIVGQLGADDFFAEIEEEDSAFILEDSPGTFFFGMELSEGEDLLFPWNGEEGFSAYVEEKAQEVLKEVDELLTYDLPESLAELPSLEKVPERSSRIVAAPPRVVPSRPVEHKSTEERADVTSQSQRAKPNNVSPSAPAPRRVVKQQGKSPAQKTTRREQVRPTTKKKEVVKSSYKRPTAKTSDMKILKTSLRPSKKKI